jgi:hypothetical protein
VLDERDIDGEEFAELLRGNEVVLRAVGEDASVAHHDHAIDFGEDVGEVVRDHENANALASDAAQGLAQLALRGEVERVGRLVEQEHLGAMDEGAGNHDAALLAGGHFANQFLFEMRGLHQVQSFMGAGTHCWGDVKVGPERGRGEESGRDGIDARGDGGALAGEFGRDDTEMGAELRDIPALAPEQEQLHFGHDDGVALAGDGANERGFAAAVGAEDGDVLALLDAEGKIVQDDVVAARDADVLHEEEFGFGWVAQEKAAGLR